MTIVGIIFAIIAFILSLLYYVNLLLLSPALSFAQAGDFGLYAALRKPGQFHCPE